MPTANSGRDQALTQFLTNCGWQHSDRGLLAGDASFRRYDRLREGSKSAVLMDAPPPTEDVRPFVKIAAILRSLGLSAPLIFAEDIEQGFLLLEDFGDQTYSTLLKDGADEFDLYRLAVDALIHLHRAFEIEREPALAHYDDEKLLEEAFLFTDWYLPAVRGVETTPAEREEYRQCWLSIFAKARLVPDTLVLRDFHVDNLIWLQDRPDVAACGLLDFQDAVLGPVSYDLVSLLEDARRDVSPAMAEKLLAHYCAAFPQMKQDRFFASYAILGAQRSAKILGIFTRLDRRDGKPVYLHHIERVWRWLDGDMEHSVLAPLKDWFDTVIPPCYRVTPEAMSKP